MRSQLLTAALALATASAVAQPRLSTEQRLELLERRASSISDMTLQIQALRQENQQLRGQLEEQQHRLNGLERKQRDLYLDIDQRLSTLQAGAPPSAAPPTATEGGSAVAAEGNGSAVPPPAAPVDPVAEQAAYDAAYDLLRPAQRRYPEAIVAFNDFLAKYPNGEFAPNARYWLAEAYYVTNQNDQALTAFRNVVEKDPASPKARGAWLKIGYLLHATGKPDEARKVLEQVVKDYPGSAEAGMAQQRLDRIASERR